MIKYNNNKIGILLYSNDSASQVMCVLRLVTARCSFVLYRIIAQFPVFLVKRLWCRENCVCGGAHPPGAHLQDTGGCMDGRS